MKESKMDAKTAMRIGSEIAERYSKAALRLAAADGPNASIERTLHGCEVWLATEIMIALQEAASAR